MNFFTIIVKLTGELILWADLIFVMESEFEEYIKNTFPEVASSKKIICLNIPDNYYFMEPALIELIKSRVAIYL